MVQNKGLIKVKGEYTEPMEGKIYVRKWFNANEVTKEEARDFIAKNIKAIPMLVESFFRRRVVGITMDELYSKEEIELLNEPYYTMLARIDKWSKEKEYWDNCEQSSELCEPKVITLLNLQEHNKVKI